MKYFIGIDLGGTNIKAGVMDEEYKIRAKTHCKTNCPRSAELIANDMAKIAIDATAAAGLTIDDIESVGIGAPGTANSSTGLIEYANNLGFHNVPLREMVSKRLGGKKTYIENDANAATYGETVAGVARGYKNVIGITLGTGLGGGIVIDGRIYNGFNHAAGEIGHNVIVFDGRQCTCGRRGCVEAYASVTGLIKTTKELMLEDKNSLIWKLSEDSLDKVSGRHSFDAMRAGDPTGRKIVYKYIEHLACGVVNLINTFQPEMMFIGGAISKEGNYILEPLKEVIQRDSYNRMSDKQTILTTAVLGNDAGLIGAAALWKLQN